jgi:hypothetical protein
MRQEQHADRRAARCGALNGAQHAARGSTARQQHAGAARGAGRGAAARTHTPESSSTRRDSARQEQAVRQTPHSAARSHAARAGQAQTRVGTRTARPGAKRCAAAAQAGPGLPGPEPKAPPLQVLLRALGRAFASPAAGCSRRASLAVLLRALAPAGEARAAAGRAPACCPSRRVRSRRGGLLLGRARSCFSAGPAPQKALSSARARAAAARASCRCARA